MSNIFTNYNNVPENYIPNNINQPPIIKKEYNIPLEIYNAKGEFVGLTWNTCDNILLNFNISGNVTYDTGVYEDAETYLTGKKLQIIFYDFKYFALFNDTFDASINAIYEISENIQKNILVPGIYYLQLNLLDDTNNISLTLISPDECQIVVK